MSIALMGIAWNLPIPSGEKMVLLALADNANDEGCCWPSVATLSRKCSLDQRTVQRIINRLIEAGHVSKIERAGTSNMWTVHPRHDATPGITPPLHQRHPPPGMMPPKPSMNHQSNSGSKDPSLQRDPFPRPDFADPQHWKDLLANRKRKHLANTPSAYARLLNDVAKFTSAEWPPGRLIQHAAEKGWGAIYDPNERMNGNGRLAHGAAGIGRTTQAALNVLAKLERATSSG